MNKSVRTDTTMLSVSDLFFQIGDMKILNGVSFTVRPGERLGIIGPNGSGKTTLFNCLSGFHFPSSGRIDFKDANITRLPPHKRADLGLGRVFQNFGVFKEMTLRENIITALESKQPPILFPWTKRYRENAKLASTYLSEIGLTNLEEKKAGSLSGGQMRLLEIIRAVAYGAELFLLDEPTAGVSPKMKGEVERILKKLQELNKTVMIIEHDINFIQKLCDRIIVLDVGKIVLDDTPEQVRNNRLLQEIYFGTNSAQA